MLLHRNGHTQGDDFALYLRQARSLFDGDIAQVVADNRFTVVNSGPVFSPDRLPVGLAAAAGAVRDRWGYDYDRLKLRRGRRASASGWCSSTASSAGAPAALLAIAVTAVVAHRAGAASCTPTSCCPSTRTPPSVAAFVWWLDRIKLRRAADRGDAPASSSCSALLAAAAFNVRRESIVLVGVIARRPGRRARRGRGAAAPRGAGAVAHRRHAVRRRSSAPCVGFQLLLPSMLFPDNGDGAGYVPDRIGDYAGRADRAPRARPAPGRRHASSSLLAVAGMVVGCIRRPRLDVPLAALTVLSRSPSAPTSGWSAATTSRSRPWVLYFAAAAVAAAIGALLPRRPAPAGHRASPPLPLAFLARRPPRRAARRHRRRRATSTAPGRQQVGPADPRVRRSSTPSRRYTAPTTSSPSSAPAR